jgi:hypothetical protein
MKSQRIVLALLGLTLMQCSQCTNAPNLKTKTSVDRIEGNVFLVTNAGDLKPARFAKVRIWRDSHRFHRIFTSGPEFQTPQFEALCRHDVGDVANEEEGWIFAGETDELGNFLFEKIQPGNYTVEVFGHSGMNAAIWSSAVSHEAAATTHVKMGKPMVSCFDPNHVVPF